MTSTRTEKVKAWVIFGCTSGELTNVIYESREKARDALRNAAYHRHPLIMREAMSRYKVVPCIISFTLPKVSNRKKK